MEAPSVETISSLLRKCEQGVHKEGWDKPPVIAALVWQPASKLSLYDTDIQILGNTPTETVNRLGDGFLTQKGEAFGTAVSEILGTSFFGFAHIWEAWQHTELDLQDTALWMENPTVPQDRIEVRMICAVDLLGRPYTLRRRRGAKPEIYSCNTELRPFGRVHEGLAKMVLASVRQMPWAADYQLDLELSGMCWLHHLAGHGSPVRVT